MNRFRSFQITKFIVFILVLLFTYAAVYSAVYIYHNKYKHDGSRFSLIDLITGRSSTSSKLKNTPEARRTANLYAEYNSSNSRSIKPAEISENSYRVVVLGFYEDYMNNKQTGQSQGATLAKYGTSNLANEFSSATAGYDPLICSNSSPDSTVITGSSTADNKVYYNLRFSNSSGVVASSQAVMVNQDGQNLVDEVICSNP